MSFTVTPPPGAEDVAMRRKKNPQTSMFLRMLVRAAVLRRGRALSALLAVIVAAAAATAMLNLYVDVQAKLQREFRNYGANVIVMAKEGAKMPADALHSVDAALAGRGIAVPFGYVVARTPDGQSVVVAGTNFEEVRKLNNWWAVTQWPQRPQAALLGTRAQAAVSPQGQPFDLSFQGHTLRLSPAGTVHTGAAEDSRIYISLQDFRAWTGLEPSTIEIAASGTTAEINAVMQKLGEAVPAADVRPVRQIVEGQAHVLGKTRATLLFASILIILTAALCVLSTLIGWVSDRRRDFAIMKALGASGRLLNSFFAAEAAALGLVGAVIGYGIGIAVAMWIGRVNFQASVVPRLSVFPVVVLGSVAVALLAAVVPISLLRRVQPAMILRGE
jgi:putative ABC transport system permease protein